MFDGFGENFGWRVGRPGVVPTERPAVPSMEGPFQFLNRVRTTVSAGFRGLVTRQLWKRDSAPKAAAGITRIMDDAHHLSFLYDPSFSFLLSVGCVLGGMANPMLFPAHPVVIAARLTYEKPGR
jgi:hypothetical protein